MPRAGPRRPATAQAPRTVAVARCRHDPVSSPAAASGSRAERIRNPSRISMVAMVAEEPAVWLAGFAGFAPWGPEVGSSCIGGPCDGSGAP
jgi:hypothetical protein